MLIYVLDIHGSPLMPTARAGKVRRMLKDGRAVITGHTPFTIRLTYGRRTTGYFVIKDAEGNTISNSVSCKSLKLVRHNNARLCFAHDGSRLIPPPAKAGGILKPIS